MIDETKPKRKSQPGKKSPEPGVEISSDLAHSSHFPLPDIYRASVAHPFGFEAAMRMMRRNELITNLPPLAVPSRKSVVPSPEVLRSQFPHPLAGPPPTRPARVSPVIAWMEDRRKRLGDELKKVLRAAAFKQFSNLKERNFNDAYQAVYDRKRGRPRKPTP
jgi:hypothetical protein